jgi:hypothetical protein
MKTFSGSEGMAQRILHLGTRWKWAVSFALFPQNEPPVTVRYEDGWAPEPVLRRQRREKKSHHCHWNSVDPVLTVLSLICLRGQKWLHSRLSCSEFPYCNSEVIVVHWVFLEGWLNGRSAHFRNYVITGRHNKCKYPCFNRDSKLWCQNNLKISQNLFVLYISVSHVLFF